MINVVILKGKAWSMFSELYQEALILRKYFRVFWTKSIIFYLLSFILQINLLNLGRLERIWPVSGVVCLQKLMNEEKERQTGWIVERVFQGCDMAGGTVQLGVGVILIQRACIKNLLWSSQMGCMLPLQTWSTVGRLGGHDWKKVIAQLREKE